MGIHGLVMVEGDHESDDEYFLIEHKHKKIQQTPSHTSKTMATNNTETLTSWSC